MAWTAAICWAHDVVTVATVGHYSDAMESRLPLPLLKRYGPYGIDGSASQSPRLHSETADMPLRNPGRQFISLSWAGDRHSKSLDGLLSRWRGTVTTSRREGEIPEQQARQQDAKNGE